MKKFIYLVFSLLLFVVIFSIPFMCFADSIKCYQGNKVIYAHHITNVTYTGDMFVFVENGTDRVIFYNGHCLAKIDV